MATGAVVAAMSSRRRSRLGWLSLTWTIRSLPVSRAISKVFLAVHGVEREYAAAQPQRGDQGLHRRDFVRLLVDDLVGENDLMVDGECAEDVRRLAVREGVKTLPQRLPVDRDEPGWGGGAGLIEPFRMASERPLQFGRIEPLQDAAHRRVGRRPPQRCLREGGIEDREPSVDQRVDLSIRSRPAQHGDDREQNHADLAVYFSFGAPPVRDVSEAGRKIDRRLHGGNLRIRLLPIDSERIRPEKQKMPPDAPAVSGGPHGLKSRALNSPELLRKIGFVANRRLLDVQRIGHDCFIGEASFQDMQRPVTVNDQRAAALRFADPRVQALLHVLLLFLLVQGTFTNKDLREHLAPLLGKKPSQLTPGRITYDLRRLRLHGLTERIPKTHRYRITPKGLRTAIFYTRLYNRSLRTGLAIISPGAANPHLPIAKSIRAAEAAVNSWYQQEKLSNCPGCAP